MLRIVIAFAVLPALAQSKPLQPVHANLTPEQRIDINHATVEQLMKAPGLTRTWAERIIRFRPYHAKNDLINQGIVPGTLYNQIKDCIIAHRDKQ